MLEPSRSEGDSWGPLVNATRKVPPASIPAPLARARILVVDDHEVVRHGLRAVLETEAGWKVVGQAEDGREALEKARRLRPDIVIMDISMPRVSGLEATRKIMKALPNTRVLVLTLHESDSVVHDLLQAGARGYVLKSDAGRELIAAVGALQQGKTYFTSRVAEMVLDGYLRERPRNGEGGARPQRLTPREREIIQLLAEGKSSKEVGVALGLSLKTAETHRTNIMHKLNFHSVSELIRYAIRNNIVEP